MSWLRLVTLVVAIVATAPRVAEAREVKPHPEWGLTPIQAGSRKGSDPAVTYAGRPLVDVLRDLNRQGLRIVFSTSLVPASLRVGAEPPGPSPRDVLDQVLRPHGLEVRPGPRDVLVAIDFRCDMEPSTTVDDTQYSKLLAQLRVPLDRCVVPRGGPEKDRVGQRDSKLAKLR